MCFRHHKRNSLSTVRCVCTGHSSCCNQLSGPVLESHGRPISVFSTSCSSLYLYQLSFFLSFFLSLCRHFFLKLFFIFLFFPFSRNTCGKWKSNIPHYTTILQQVQQLLYIYKIIPPHTIAISLWPCRWDGKRTSRSSRP